MPSDRIGTGISRRYRQRGFSLFELIIALSVGVIVLGAAIGYLLREMRTLAGSEIRQSLNRNARYIAITLRHDIQKAGVDIDSNITFGTVATWAGTYGDTLLILHVPYLPEPAPLHSLIPPTGTDDPLPAGGTCGARCVDLLKDPAQPLELQPRNLARLQVRDTRRLILIDEVTETSATSFQASFTELPTILRLTAGLDGGLQLTRTGTFVQKLAPILYYVDAEQQLIRAERMNLDGTLDGDIVAYGVDKFDVKLLFADGDELEVANYNDTDDSNDYDDIVGIKVAVTVAAYRADPRVNQGELLKRDYEWFISPRNLRYERNR